MTMYIIVYYVMMCIQDLAGQVHKRGFKSLINWVTATYVQSLFWIKACDQARYFEIGSKNIIFYFI